MNDRPDRTLWVVFTLSCGILGYEIALMRILLYASWHHFAFLVISAALLGFGASGTVLSFFRSWFVNRGPGAVVALAAAAAVSMPLSVQIAQKIPVEARFVPTLILEQALWWGAYWAVLVIPFLAGGMGIGLSLMLAGRGLPTTYATNLAGSAVGVLLATGLMHVAAPEWLPVFMMAVVFAGVATAVRRVHFLILIGVVIAGGFWFAARPPQIRIDPYKYLAYVHRLEEDGNARRVSRIFGPRAVIELYEGPAFHDLPFLSVTETPPAMSSIVLDGQLGGSLLYADDLESARVVDGTLMSFPYNFVKENPAVLLLGETGGANIWLAARKAARRIQVVQPNGDLVHLLRSTPAGGAVFELPGVVIAHDTPRHFVDHTGDPYDLIQLASMESWAIETGGIGGLHHNYLITTEGLRRCLERLSPDGILSVGRAIQLPPRDNIKLLFTLARSLESMGLENPEDHIVMFRDYLAVCTMVKRSPWSPEEINRLRLAASGRELTPVFFPGIRGDELNRPDHLPGPAGQPGDWLHYAAREILTRNAASFVDSWAFDIRPPTDDRPFFGNFTRLAAITELRRTFGALWLTRTELALLFVLAAVTVIAVVGALLTVLPFLSLQSVRRSRGAGVTALYFGAIGLAYLALEITMLSRLTRLIGDPVLAGAATIGGFLLFSGLGSLAAQRGPTEQRIRFIFVALVIVGFLEWWLVDWVSSLAGSFSTAVRFGLATVIIGPLGFLMGFPMPTALARLERAAPQLVPWAWGINGFASVLAPPMATAIGMTLGFSIAGMVALVCYLTAATLVAHLPREKTV